MGDRPTYASVTGEPCTCKYLQRAAEDPRVPIIFDDRTGEYQYTYQEPRSRGASTLVIYHCPFCGGAAPASKRHLLFRVIPPEEEERLIALLGRIHTIADTLKSLGKPDDDNPTGTVSKTDETEDSPPSTRFARTLTYKRLSDSADVRIEARPDGTVSCWLQGKYVGDAQPAPAPNQSLQLVRRCLARLARLLRLR